MPEDTPEEKKPEESEQTPKTTDELVTVASTFITYLQNGGFEVEEMVCVFALATTHVQVELLMKTILKTAKVVAIPTQLMNTIVQKPSEN